MSGRDKKFELDEEDEITAQPTALPDEMGNRISSHEVGLSVDPDDLGRTFLSDATEQGNFESEYDDSVERYVAEGSRTDDALTGPNFDSSNDVWENTVNLTVQGGSEQVQPLVDDHADGMRFVEEDDESTESDSVDTTENEVRDASLMDRESEEYGETESPEVRTEDAHHGKKQGGHSPRNPATRKPKSTSTQRER